MTKRGNGANKMLRSRLWFDNPSDLGMTALYFERYLNFGLTRRELQSSKPIIGIAQTGSDLSPCNRHHLQLALRVREGIREAGGVALEFPTHPIQETGKRPTAALDRNLAYLGLVEVLFGYPGGAEVVNMQPPAALIRCGIKSLPCIGDGRQSGTSGSPSILNASPEAAAGGGLALLQSGDRLRVDLRKGEANILILADELRKRREALNAKGGFPYPENHTPWQEPYRKNVGQHASGACLEIATRYQDIATRFGTPRHSH